MYEFKEWLKMYLGEFEDEEGEKNLNMLSLMINYIAS